jgi:hypothetical protein
MIMVGWQNKMNVVSNAHGPQSILYTMQVKNAGAKNSKDSLSLQVGSWQVFMKAYSQ